MHVEGWGVEVWVLGMSDVRCKAKGLQALQWFLIPSRTYYMCRYQYKYRQINI